MICKRIEAYKMYYEWLEEQDALSEGSDINIFRRLKRYLNIRVKQLFTKS